ncbi:hypothetical protein M9Y10_038093 [Tritrichomonas musculus]|uniref:Uncharacterized protein n=1 Tax=Tritrichomonas musculus TaxID=1915356 RepID=A0ABR2K9A2_9EUKA
MEIPAKERCMLIKSITDECNKSFSSLENIHDIIQFQENRIKQLESELKYKDKLNKQILIENAQYSIDSLTTLLDIIWPLTKKSDFQRSLISNVKFIDILFENLQSAYSSSLLFPLIGILANLNSNDIFRSKIGFKSVFLILEKNGSTILQNYECQQVFLYLLYNISFDIIIINDILRKCPLLKFIKENSNRIVNIPELRDLLFKLLKQITNSIIDDISTNIMDKNDFLLKINEICNSDSLNKFHQSNEILQITDRYFAQKD